jgi:hypothetical protein
MLTRGDTVLRYRFCCFDHRGRLYHADVFECADDGEARRKLQQLFSSQPQACSFELWQLNRLVLAGLASVYRQTAPHESARR